jgi:integration host factor subunit beta
MNKSELIRSLGDEANLPPEEAALVVNTFVDCMKESMLANERVEIRCLG